METVWNEPARLLRVMAHPARLAILEALCERPRCVKDINSLLSMAQPHLSQHMAALRKAKLVASHVCGALRCYYVLQPTLVKEMIRLLSQQHTLQLRTRDSVMRESRQAGHSRGVSVAGFPDFSADSRRN